MRNMVGIVGENNCNWNSPISTLQTILHRRSSESITVYEVTSIGCVRRIQLYQISFAYLAILFTGPLQSIFQMTLKGNSDLFSFFENSSSKYLCKFLNSLYSFSKITLHENDQNNFQKLNHWDLITLQLLPNSWDLTLVLWIWDYYCQNIIEETNSNIFKALWSF